MSVKFFNEDKQQWEKIASLLASQIFTLDVEGNYDSQTVEGCLQEIADALNNKFDDVNCTSNGMLNFYSNGVIKKSVVIPTGRGSDVSNEIIIKMQQQLNDHEQRIAWLEENGGGGGGTGNNTAPTITSTFEGTSFSTDDEIEIPYFLMDNQGGNFKAIYTIDGTTSNAPAVLGPNTWKVGKLPKGKHVLKIYIKDFSLFSNELVFNVTVGSLEISSTFREKDYGLNDSIVVNYDIESINNEEIHVERILDDKKEVVAGNPGRNTWSLGQLSKGNHKIELKAYTDTSISNILTYRFTITDSSSLFISTSFENEIWNVEDRLIIPYRISLLGTSKFKAKYTINGVSQPLADAALGMNFWDLGYPEIGEYEYTIQATSVDGTMESNIITLNVNVQATDFTPVRPVEDFLLCWFDAKGKSNAFEDREEWIDKSGNNVQATLVDVNYSNNGWIKDGLRLNGDAYVEIDMKPFENGVPNTGLTIDVQYDFNHSGDDQARVLSCELPMVPFTGVSIDSLDINLLGSESINKSPNNEGNLIRATFVINPEIQRSYIYVNGVICNTALLSDNERYVHDSKIYLNAMRDPDGNIVNISDCTIYNLRVYDKALTSEEIVQNHISDMKIEDQKIAVKRNTFTSLGQIDFDGDFTGMGADDQVPLRVAFSPNDGPGVKFDYPRVMTDWQGNSSLQYAIKNYNIDLFDEEGNETKIKMQDSWPEQDSYHIKANMVDSSHAFNLGIAKLLPTIYTEPHPGITENPDKDIKYAVDGFPVSCFINGKFHGLYTFNLKQHRDVFGMSKTNPKHFMYRAEENSAMGAAAFRDSSNFSIEQEWEERHPKRPPGTGVDHVEFRRLIDFVKDTPDNVFVRDLPRYFNKNYLIDYYLICYVFGGIDSLGKNMTMASWDATATSGIWYPMFYDMDTFFGFDNKGELVWGPDVRCPEDYNTSGSLLWERLVKLCQTDIRNRYAVLRRGGLNLDNVLKVLRGEIIDPIGETFYNMDAENKYLPLGATYLYMAKGNRVQHLERWLKARFLYSDSMFEFLPDVENSVIIRNTCSGLWKLRIKTYTPQLIKVEFGGTGVSGEEPYKGILTKMCNNKEWTEFSYFFDGVYQRDISITGAKYITGLEGVANGETLMCDVSLCEKLIELDAHGNPNLTSINLSNCIRLKRLDLHDCTRLGSTTGTPLDVGNCYNLKYLDISNTSVPALTTTQCSYLTQVNISNTLISSINYSHLQSLKDLRISNCSRLTSVTVNSCQGVTDLNIVDNPALREIIIDNCKSLRSLTLNNLNSLTTLSIADCDNLTYIKIRTANSLSTIDLSKCKGLITFDANGIPLADIKFGAISTLKTLDLSNNKKLRTLDFRGCESQLESFKVTNTENLKYVYGLNLLVKNYEQTAVFRDNDFIQIINGDIYFSDDVTSARDFFRGCMDLTEAPKMHLNKVNSLSSMYFNCTSLTTIPEMDTSLIDDMSYMFYGCEKLETTPNFNTANVTNFNYMFSGCLSITTSAQYDLSSTTSLQGMYKNCSGLEVVTNMNTENIQNFSEIFMDCVKLQYIPNFNMSSATNLSYFLDGCVQLRLVPELNTAKVTNFNRAFGRCEFLTQFPALDTSAATNTSYMLYGCTGLTAVPVLDLSAAKNVSGMFDGCLRLASLPVLDTSKAVHMSGFLKGCSALTAIEELDTSSAEDISSILWDCRGLTSIPALNTTNVTNMYESFYGCSNLKTIPDFITTDESMESATAKVTNFKGTFNSCSSLTAIPSIVTSAAIDISDLFNNCSAITEVPRLDITKVKTANGLFSGCIKLAKTPELFTTDSSEPGRRITVAYSMFADCRSLTALPVLNTSNMENMNAMFAGCNSVTEIGEMDTANCKYISGIFRGCEKATTLPDLDLRNVTDAVGIFDGCKSLVQSPRLLNLSASCTSLAQLYRGCENITTIPEIDLVNVNDLSEAFRNCSSLEIVPTFKNGTGKIKDMNNIFSGCISLSNIPELDTSNVETMSGAFNGCTALTTAPSWTTSKVRVFDSMFANCTALITIPQYDTTEAVSMSSFVSGCKLLRTIPLLNTSKVKNFSNMFRGCDLLDVVPAIDTSSADSMQEMFKDCLSIVSIPKSIVTTSASNVSSLFSGCIKLRSLHELDLGNVLSVYGASMVLYGCNALESCSFRNNKVNFEASLLENLTSIKFFDTGRSVTLTVTSNPALTSEALDEMFEALNEVEKATINITGNLGSFGCNAFIAENKGWTVIMEYAMTYPLYPRQ